MDPSRSHRLIHVTNNCVIFIIIISIIKYIKNEIYSSKIKNIYIYMMMIYYKLI